MGRPRTLSAPRAASDDDEGEETTTTVMNPYFEKLMGASADFVRQHRQYPVDANTIGSIVDRSPSKESTQLRIVEHAQGVRILLDERAVVISIDFLRHKQTFGNAIEKAVYCEMSFEGFIERLLKKRPLAFYKTEDKTLLRGCPKDKMLGNMHAQWLKVGTIDEESPLVLEEYLSYEEMEVSALICVSVPTFFINKGDRKNKGIMTVGDHEEEGVLIGAVGARFVVPTLMEGKYMLRSSDAQLSIKSHPDLVDVWQLTYEVGKQHPNRFAPVSNEYELDTVAYAIRLEMILLPIILHADVEGRNRNQTVHLRLVGFGLGIWALDASKQSSIYVEVVRKILNNHTLDFLEVIELQWILPGSPNELITCKNGKAIRVIYTEGNIADRLGEGRLLVATYAWDSNSFPGNEYWGGLHLIGRSGDSAAAACSTIQELQNPYVNEDMTNKDRILIYS